MNKDLVAIFEYLEREKGIKRETIVQAIEESLQTAARQSVHGASNVTVKINPKNGDINVYSEKEIVDDVEVAAREISLKDAREIDPDCELGQFIDIMVTPNNFGRIAAQKARAVISKKLRSAEKEIIHKEFRDRVGTIVSGTVKKVLRGANLIVDLGKAEAILLGQYYPKTEKYKEGDRLIALLLDVEDTENEGAQIVLSRTDPEFIVKLLQQEVPEVSDGSVIIDKIARDPGYRTKIVVHANDMRIDPVGSCVGVRGARVKNLINELHEKIDIVPFSENPLMLLQNLLKPIEIKKSFLDAETHVATIVVDDEDFAAVVGKRKMNQQLNGELIGYQLDVLKSTEFALLQAGLEHSEEDLSFDLDTPLEEVEILKKYLNSLIFEQLISEGYKDVRALMSKTPQQLAEIPGVSLELANKIYDLLRYSFKSKAETAE